MPASFQVDVDRRIVFSRGWGILVDDDLRETQKGVRESPGFTPDFSQLYDFSEVTDIRVTEETLWGLAGTSPFGLRARRAVVVASDAAFGVARTYQAISGRQSDTFRIFRYRDSALRWLDGEGVD